MAYAKAQTWLPFLRRGSLQFHMLLALLLLSLLAQRIDTANAKLTFLSRKRHPFATGEWLFIDVLMAGWPLLLFCNQPPLMGIRSITCRPHAVYRGPS